MVVGVCSGVPEGEGGRCWKSRNPTLFKRNQLTAPGTYLSLGLSR